jgi:hypothetical protein
MSSARLTRFWISRARCRWQHHNSRWLDRLILPHTHGPKQICSAHAWDTHVVTPQRPTDFLGAEQHRADEVCPWRFGEAKTHQQHHDLQTDQQHQHAAEVRHWLRAVGSCQTVQQGTTGNQAKRCCITAGPIEGAHRQYTIQHRTAYHTARRHQPGTTQPHDPKQENVAVASKANEVHQARRALQTLGKPGVAPDNVDKEHLQNVQGTLKGIRPVGRRGQHAKDENANTTHTTHTHRVGL